MTDAPLPILEAIDRLRATDEGAADDVVDALQWMLGDSPLSRLNQAGVQQFLWYELPYKWFGRPDRHVGVVRALRRFFDLAGYPRYAELCDSPFTREQLARFASGDVSDGFRRFLRRHESSGVVPPDVPGFAWGELMGRAEFDAYWQVAMGLEVAVAGGLVTPGAPGWRDVRSSVVRAVLSRPQPERFDQTPAEEIALERMAAWIEGPAGASQARSQLLSGISHRLLHEIRPPRGARAAMAPLRWLRSVASQDGGLRLTATGALPRSAVIEAAALFGTRLGRARPTAPTREAQLPELVALREVACRGGVVRRHAGRLVVADIDASTVPRQAEWHAAVAGFVPAKGVDALVWPVLLAALLEGGQSSDRLIREASVVLTESGRTRAGGVPLPLADARASLVRLAALLGVLGGLRTPSSGASRITLSPFGVDLARAVVRHVATAPTRREG